MILGGIIQNLFLDFNNPSFIQLRYSIDIFYMVHHPYLMDHPQIMYPPILIQVPDPMVLDHIIYTIESHKIADSPPPYESCTGKENIDDVVVYVHH